MHHFFFLAFIHAILSPYDVHVSPVFLVHFYCLTRSSYGVRASPIFWHPFSCFHSLPLRLPCVASADFKVSTKNCWRIPGLWNAFQLETWQKYGFGARWLDKSKVFTGPDPTKKVFTVPDSIKLMFSFKSRLANERPEPSRSNLESPELSRLYVQWRRMWSNIL